jgi:hypothetical protein
MEVYKKYVSAPEKDKWGGYQSGKYVQLFFPNCQKPRK